MIPCEPAVSAEAVKDAVPLLIGAVPMTVVPSTNRTLPVAAAGDSFAVKVTAWLAAEGFGEDVRVMLVGVRLTIVKFNTADVLIE